MIPAAGVLDNRPPTNEFIHIYNGGWLVKQGDWFIKGLDSFNKPKNHLLRVSVLKTERDLFIKIQFLTTHFKLTLFYALVLF